MKVVVVRHAQAEHNVGESGERANDETSKEVHLTDIGRAQAARLAEELSDQQFDALICSELKRCIETAEVLNSQRHLPITTDKRLNDIRTGMSGRPFAEFRAALDASDDPWNVHFNDGESVADEQRRTLDFLTELKSKSYQSVLVVTHGGVANIIYGFAHGLNNEQIFNREIANAAVFTIEL